MNRFLCASAVVVISYFHFIQEHNCFAYKINLSYWLRDFVDCHVEIYVYGSNKVDFGGFEFPLWLSSSNTSSIRFINGYEHEKLYLRLRRQLCTLDVIVPFIWFRKWPKISEKLQFKCVDTERTKLTLERSYSDSDGFSFQILIIPHGEESNPNLEYMSERFQGYGKRMEFFYFNFAVGKSGDFELTNIMYYLPSSRLSYETDGVVPLCFSKQEIRSKMLRLSNEIYNGGRYVVGHLITYGFSPIMPDYGVDEYYFNIILTSHPDFEYIRDMTTREYYFSGRREVSFLRLNQAILFDHIPTNISRYFVKEINTRVLLFEHNLNINFVQCFRK